MRINTNLVAMSTFTQYTKMQSRVSGAITKLSSSYAINTAADDAAGLAISEKMRAQIRGLDKAGSNATDAISLVQTAEGALSESTSILQRMRELAVQSSSDTNGDSIDRTAFEDEFSQLQAELDNISSSTMYNRKNLLDGSLSLSIKSVSNQVLANTGLTVSLGNAADGAYNFGISTKLKSAAVTGKQADTASVTLSSDDYFKSTSSASVDTGSAKSEMLNGNYTVSAAYSTSTQGMTVTATGDNGQRFTAEITQTALSAVSATNPLIINFESSSGMDDGFSLKLDLTNSISATEYNYSTLAAEVSKLTASVSGGVTASAATYGVYANLTGAKSVKLESGMSSATFSNGVTVDFDTLTATGVDTTNRATVGAATGAVTVAGGTATLGNLKAADDSGLSNGALSISSALDGSGNTVITAVDSSGASYTNTLTAAQLAALQTSSTTPSTTALTFLDGSKNASFTMDFVTAATTSGTATTLNGSTAFDGISLAVSGAGHNYDAIFGSTATHSTTVTTAGGYTVSNLTGFYGVDTNSLSISGAPVTGDYRLFANYGFIYKLTNSSTNNQITCLAASGSVSYVGVTGTVYGMDDLEPSIDNSGTYTKLTYGGRTYTANLANSSVLNNGESADVTFSDGSGNSFTLKLTSSNDGMTAGHMLGSITNITVRSDDHENGAYIPVLNGSNFYSALLFESDYLVATGGTETLALNGTAGNFALSFQTIFNINDSHDLVYTRLAIPSSPCPAARR